MPKSLASKCKEFWTHDRRGVLARGLFRLAELKHGGDTKTACKLLHGDVFGNTGVQPPKVEQWTQYIATFPEHGGLKGRIKISLIIVCLEINKKWMLQGLDTSNDDAMAALDRLIAEHDHVFDDTECLEIKAAFSANEGLAPEAATVLTFTENFLGLTREQMANGVTHLFPDWEGTLGRTGTYQNYVVYRFQATPKQILKTFVALERPSVERPYARLTSTLYDGDSQTPGRGIVLPMGRSTYLIGSLDGGAGLQIFKFSQMHRGKDLQADDAALPGLVMSFDAPGTSVVARALLVPCDAETPEAAGCGKLDFDIALEEIGPHQLEKLRNRIDFDTENNITLNGTVLTRGKVRDLTLEAVRAHLDGSQIDFSPLTAGEGEEPKEFNPAATDHYPFNSALRDFS